jgi:hypothetical protein
MDPMQIPLPEAENIGTRWLRIPEVFHFDGTPVS